jgi:putative aldouronate transport system permease protein
MTRSLQTDILPIKSAPGFFSRIARDFKKNRLLYLMIFPVIVYYIIFNYGPMYGLQIAFKDFNLRAGYWASPWVGFKHFKLFFESYYFGRVLRNTLLISVYSLIFSFPATIVFALLLNEIRNRIFKRFVQTITYIPHFISIIIICGIIVDFCMSDGLINDIISFLGGARTPLLQEMKYFRSVYIISGMWQGLGWGTIIYLSAITNIDQELYQAAIIDGANRFRQIWHITLTGIRPTIIILLILRMGSVLNVGFEKVILLYNPATYEVADVISSYVYRRGLQQLNWSYGAAVGLFNSVVNLILVVTSNRVSKKVSDISLW